MYVKKNHYFPVPEGLPEKMHKLDRTNSSTVNLLLQANIVDIPVPLKTNPNHNAPFISLLFQVDWWH